MGRGSCRHRRAFCGRDARDGNLGKQASAGERCDLAEVRDPALVATMSRSQYADRMVPATHQIVIDVAAKFRSFPSFPAAEMLYAR
jgi:hypothetical protein